MSLKQILTLEIWVFWLWKYTDKNILLLCENECLADRGVLHICFCQGFQDVILSNQVLFYISLQLIILLQLLLKQCLKERIEGKTFLTGHSFNLNRQHKAIKKRQYSFSWSLTLISARSVVTRTPVMSSLWIRSRSWLSNEILCFRISSTLPRIALNFCKDDVSSTKKRDHYIFRDNE